MGKDLAFGFPLDSFTLTLTRVPPRPLLPSPPAWREVGADCVAAWFDGGGKRHDVSHLPRVEGYLAHKKLPPPRTLQ